MSVQTSINQYFKIKYKCTQNVNTKSEDFSFKAKSLEKKHSSTKLKASKKRSKKKLSAIVEPSLYCDVIYEDKNICNVNKSINNVQLFDTTVDSTSYVTEIYISDDEENKKIDTLPGCSIIYESISDDNKSKVIECKEQTIKAVDIEIQSKGLKRSVSPYNDEVRKDRKIEYQISAKKIDRSHSSEECLEISSTQHKTLSNKESNFSLQCNASTQSVLNSPSKQTTFTPRKSSAKKVLSFNSENKNSTNFLFRTIVNRELTITAIENLNLVKEGAIQANSFDLEKIYASNSFTPKYNRADTTLPTRYEYCDVVIPMESNAAHLFMIIVNVFSNPINCGYFDKDETDFIFSILTLPVQAQMLLAHMLKRKRSWHKVENLQNKYNIIHNMIPMCKELESKSVFTSKIENEELSTWFKILQGDEIRKICQALKLKVNNNKEKLVQTLLKVATEKPLFPGVKSPGDKLKSLVLDRLGYCINLTKKTIDIFDKILTLLIPNRDPQETLQETYFMLIQVELGKILFPKFSNKIYPIFRNNKQLLEYIEAKHELTNILNAIEKKEWETVRNIGKLAYDQWLIIMDNESTSLEDSTLPLHVRHFMPGYLWLKILSKSIDAFKKVNHMLPDAVEILNILIKQNCHMQSKKGMWYAELALIEIHHKKDLEASANVILESLKIETLSEVGTAELLERAKKLVKRRKLNSTTCANIQAALKSMENSFSCPPPKLTTVKAPLVKEHYGINQKKSKWCININENSKEYVSVEYVALDFYKTQGFNNGIHCEGALPVTLFFVLFWEELYNIDVPGSFVTLYQKAPLDLFTQDFYKNRKNDIDRKLQKFRHLDPESFSNLMQSKFASCRHFESMVHTTLFKSNDIKDIVYCLGTEGVIGICEQLIRNYSLWKAGFPDLIVWNTNCKSCKIIEVKGPRDKLSIKQTLWLKYLDQLGLDVEVCLVKDGEHEKSKRS